MYLSLQQSEKEWLAMRDGTLGAALKNLDSIKREIISDPFSGLVHAVSGQQISGKAHSAIWAKICQKTGSIQPEKFVKLSPEEFRAFGLSSKKSQYIKNIAEAFVRGELNPKTMESMTNEEISTLLSRFPGIGPWTIEMLLIFTFKRPDIFSFGDLGIKKGLMCLHKLPALNRELFEYYRALYSPCGTAASLCFWEIASKPRWPLNS